MYVSATRTHDAYLQRELITSCVFSLVLCVVFTFVFVPNDVPVPLWGAHGIAADLVPTAFMLTLVGNTVITLVAGHRLRAGQVAPLSDAQCGWLARRLPRGPALRVLLSAVLVTVFVVPLTVVLLRMLGVAAMKFEHYVLFKACFGPLSAALSVKSAVHGALLR